MFDLNSLISKNFFEFKQLLSEEKLTDNLRKNPKANAALQKLEEVCLNIERWDETLKTKCSIGQGQIADVSWLTIHSDKVPTEVNDKNEPDYSIQSGFYICILWKRDLTDAVICLMHGVTEVDNRIKLEAKKTGKKLSLKKVLAKANFEIIQKCPELGLKFIDYRGFLEDQEKRLSLLGRNYESSILTGEYIGSKDVVTLIQKYLVLLLKIAGKLFPNWDYYSALFWNAEANLEIDAESQENKLIAEKEAAHLIIDESHSGPLDEVGKAKIRKYQNQFRKNLMITFRNKCPITNVDIPVFLRASHIKPYRKSKDDEKIDTDNGILLSEWVDFLFDKGYITFQDNGTICVSNELLKSGILNYITLDLTKQYDIKMTSKKEEYLKYHRENIFKK